MISVCGVDAYKKGWVAVFLTNDAPASVIVRPSIRGILVAAELREVSTIAIDIPIGLAVKGYRAADSEARKVLGPRSSSVFALPTRKVLEMHPYEEACAHALPGPKPSLQAYALRDKIFEVEKQVKDKQIFEVHPEISFVAMASSDDWRSPVPRLVTPEVGGIPSKKSWNGFCRRLELIEQHGITLPRHLDGADGEAGPDDVLDAAAAAWTARRIDAGCAGSLPDPPELIKKRAVAIWY